MKTTIYTLLLSTLSTSLFSQITINQNDVGPVNRKVSVTIDDNFPNASPGNSGANVTWSVGQLGIDIIDTFTFANPQFTPYFSSYPNSNLAMISTMPVYGYASLTGSSFSILGQQDGMGYDYRFIRPETILKFPLSYQSSFTDTSITLLQMYMGFDPGIGNVVDSFRTTTTTNKQVLVDGWGTLTTPLGTYPSLRLNTLRYETTTSEYLLNGTWIPATPATTDSSRVYSWWANNIGVQLLELTEDLATGDITEAQTVTGSQTILGTNELTTVSSVRVFPNPVSEELHITTAMTDYTVELIDMQGRTVIAENSTGENYSLNLSSVNAGAYMLRLTDRSTGAIRFEKIAVNH